MSYLPQYRKFAVAESGFDLAVGFALGKPKQCFSDSRTLPSAVRQNGR
jgi:hypothetical protein